MTKTKKPTCRICKKPVYVRNGLKISKWCTAHKKEQEALKKAQKLEKKKLTKSWQKTEFKRLHKIAWKLFSEYVRSKDSVNGKSQCYTCDKWVDWKHEANAGHYFHGKLDFSMSNVKNQCIRCNHHKSGAGADYGVKLAKELGVEGMEKLRLDANTKTYTIEDLERVIENMNIALAKL